MLFLVEFEFGLGGSDQWRLCVIEAKDFNDACSMMRLNRSTIDKFGRMEVPEYLRHHVRGDDPSWIKLTEIDCFSTLGDLKEKHGNKAPPPPPCLFEQWEDDRRLRDLRASRH